MDICIDFNGNKSFRLLNIYERLNKGESINKKHIANDFGISLRTAQRDIEDLRTYLSETHFSEKEVSIRYDRRQDCYYLVRPEREWLTNKEVLALCKILLESRALNKEEITGIIKKLILQISPADRATTENIIRNELFYYVPLKHNKALLSPIWQLSKSISNQSIIEFYYIRQDGKQSKQKVKPVSILFSEFYFYLIAFSIDSQKNYPIIFRIDRMIDTKETGEHFDIPYKDRFNDGEFRKRIQFMYSGELKTVKFKFKGVVEAVLDRLPTAKILEHKNGIYTISVETYGNGIYMWLKSQGDRVRLLNN